jgi:hypothetical protein
MATKTRTTKGAAVDTQAQEERADAAAGAVVDQPAERHEIVPVAEERPLPSIGLLGGKSFPDDNLASALARAQGVVRGVEKDRRNTFHKYKYASAENLISEGSAALSACGLALVPIKQALVAAGTGADLHRQFLLMHRCGDRIPLEVVWPVVEEKGRPIDKAVAIASTLSLGYLLRDLLLMPRVDEQDEPDTRGEHQPAAPAPRPAPPAPAPTPAPSANGTGNGHPAAPDGVTAEQLQRMVAAKKELFTLEKPADMDARWKELLAPFGVASAKALTRDQATAFLAALASTIIEADRKRPVAEAPAEADGF